MGLFDSVGNFLNDSFEGLCGGGGEFGEWWDGLSSAEQIALDASVRLLEELGPTLARLAYPV